VDIELQICSRCPPTSRKHIGPDPRNIGVFNYNNARLFSHELMSEYISAFTTSETPIDPWTVQIARRYQETAYGKPNSIPFVGGELFRAAWFSCVRLMDLEPKHSDFRGCPLCKEMPKNLICDGVSIAFGRNQVKSDLEPPTAIGPESPKRPSKPCQKKEWIVDAVRRKQLRDWLQSGLDSKASQGDKNEERLLEIALSRRSIFQELECWLASVNQHLSRLFSRTLSFQVVHNSFSWKPRAQHLRLFQLVSDRKE
jgi:CxC4 like cysteine cluster associated with KDZ transposases